MYNTHMEEMTPQRLAQMIAAAGTNPTALAEKIGRDKDYLRDYINGRKKSLKAGELLRIVNELDANRAITPSRQVSIDRSVRGLGVVGNIQAGAWIEAHLHSDDEIQTIPIGIDPRFSHASQYALRVIGDSMDLEAPDGSYVVCVSFAESGLSYRPGMLVHVERTMNGMSETTLKQIGEENGNVILLPRSTNPSYKPIYLDQEGGIEAEIRGVVLSVYRPQVL